MDRLTSSDWWWDVAFDGIASSMLAAALALVGISWTLKHDRRVSLEAERRQEIRRLLRLT